MSVTAFTPEELESLEKDTGLIPRFIFIPVGVTTITMAALQWPGPHWGWQSLWALITAYCLFCWTSCFHETVHQTLSRSRWLSIAIGRLIGTAIWIPYNVYRESHIRHHAYLNKPTDWELWPYSDPTTSRGFRRLFVWFDFFLNIFASAYIYGRIYFHKNSPLKNPKLRATIRNEYILCAVIWGSLVASVTYFGVWTDFARAWLLPSYLAGYFQAIRKFTEHLGMASYDPMLGTRTVIGDNLFTRFCTYVNFDIFVHGPHHRHPRVAHAQLEVKMHDYMQQNPQATYPVFESYWQAIRHMLPSMLKNPGVGMNVGAPPPGAEKEHVENFVQDVTTEILADTDVVIAGPSR